MFYNVTKIHHIWIVYSNHEYIRHYGPNSMLLCCDDIGKRYIRIREKNFLVILLGPNILGERFRPGGFVQKVYVLTPGCAVRIRYIFSASDGVQSKSGTSSVRVSMCSKSKAYIQYKRGCAVRIRHMIGTSEDVQYKQGKSSSFRTREHYSKILPNDCIITLAKVRSKTTCTKLKN